LPRKEEAVSLLDEIEEEEDFTGRVRRTKDGRPYVLANPDWENPSAFTLKPGEPRGRSSIYTRCTTYVSCLEDTYSLGDWQQRMVLIGAAMRPSLIQRVQNVDLNGNPQTVKAELNQIAEEAKNAAGWKEKADRGTAFHRTAEIVDSAGGLDPAYLFSPETAASLNAYVVKTKGWEYAHIEQGMVNDTYRTYGTPDRLRWVRGGDDRFNPEQRGRIVSEDGLTDRRWGSKLRVTDIKTGSIEYGWQKMELQLALYALSDLYDPDTGIRTELDIDQEFAEVVHVPQGEGACTVYTVPIATAVDVLRKLVPAVRAYRGRKRSWGVAAVDSATAPLAAAWPTA
jgi:hypothetical protein